MALMESAIIHNKGHCRIYRNGQIPYIEYNDIHEYHDRIPDFIVDSENGYSIFVDGHSVPDLLGTHGFNNSADDMQAIFMAVGPSFKSGKVIEEQIANIHLYEMFCELLCEVEPNENNGTKGVYSKVMFKENW